MKAPQTSTSEKGLVSEERIATVLANLRSVGYALVQAVISEDEADELRTAVEAILSTEPNNRLRSGHQRGRQIAHRDLAFTMPLCHAFVLEVSRRYLGRDLVCSSLTTNTLWPGCTERYWHVDHPYWTLEEPYPVFPLSVQAIWMLDDFTEENGATAVIPGSHLRPCKPDLAGGWSEGAVQLVGKKGSVIVADGALWHTSCPNRTAHARSALLVKYIRSCCIPQEDLRHELEKMQDAPQLVRQLFGANQYRPTRSDDPY